MKGSQWREFTDPFCLRPGEAAALLAGHPWTRFVAIGDSVAEGIGDLVDGYSELAWSDRLAAELAMWRPELAYLNLGQRDLVAGQVRARQLGAALEFGPDLAFVACGANDALRSSYQPDLVDAELTAIIEPLRARGCAVVTVGLFDTAFAPMIPPRVKHLIGARMRTLSRRTALLAARLGAIHVNTTGHPAEADSDVHSADGLHGNMRGHAICVAETVRRLGDFLGNSFTSSSCEPRAPR